MIGTVHCYIQDGIIMEITHSTEVLHQPVSLMHNTPTPSAAGVHKYMWLLVINITTHSMNQLSTNMRSTSTIGMEVCYILRCLIMENIQSMVSLRIQNVKPMLNIPIPL